jgi:hypothetical protein
MMGHQLVGVKDGSKTLVMSILLAPVSCMSLEVFAHYGVQRFWDPDMERKEKSRDKELRDKG